jgi:hypothetical protein
MTYPTSKLEERVRVKWITISLLTVAGQENVLPVEVQGYGEASVGKSKRRESRG